MVANNGRAESMGERKGHTGASGFASRWPA
jgi:hypothetical protein